MKLKTLLATGTALAVAIGLSAAANAGKDLDRVMKTKVLKVATDANWAPQSFLNDKNEMDGFDVDVAKEIARRLGATVKFVTPEWGVITGGKWAGRWDISVGSMTPTKKRAEVLTFPGVYYYTPASFAVHKDSKATKISDLNGKKIGAAAATTYEQYLEKKLVIDAEGAPPFTYQVTPGSIHSLKDSTAIMDDQRLGDGVRMDGMLGALPAIQSAIKKGYPLRVLGAPAFYEPLSVAIDKGDTEFAAKLSAIIKAMHADGTLTKLSKKWYGIDYSTSSPSS